MLHRVNKLQLEAGCATEAQAFELRHNFSRACQGQIAEVIDKVCSRYVTEDEWVQIERIEVNLGYFDIQSFERIFTNLFSRKFEEALSKKINLIPVTEKASLKQTSRLELLIYFLQTGTLPWWAQDETLNINTVFTQVAEKQRQPLYLFLEQHKFSDPIWQRIAMQFKIETHNVLVSFFPQFANAEKRLMQWSGLFSGQIDNPGYEINFNKQLAAQQQKFILYHAPVFFSEARQDGVMEQMIKQYAIEFTGIALIGLSPAEVAEKIIAHEKNNVADEIVKFTAMNDSEGEEKMEIITKEAVQAEKFIVHSAGAVLVAPYFKQLFTHLNLLEQGEWKNREAHYKAIHLVKYLVTGKQNCPEHSLVLEKLLCGMEMNTPIPAEAKLSEQEMVEATELLVAVISNWTKLKNTSVEGLRETFLKRDGILTRRENGWLLQVERKTVDVLLDSIPWSYATLAFTWNNYIIFTEW